MRCSVADTVSATQGMLVAPMERNGDHIIVPNGNGNEGPGRLNNETTSVPGMLMVASRCRADFTVTANTATTVTIEAEIKTSETGADDSYYVWFDDTSDKYSWHAGVSACVLLSMV